MKTRLLAFLLIATAAASAVAETYTAPITRPRTKPRERPAPPVTQTEVDGVIPRGIRSGNFLQMFNPRAPRKYGTSQEAIIFDLSPMNSEPAQNGRTNPGKWKGIKFFVFRF